MPLILGLDRTLSTTRTTRIVCLRFMVERGGFADRRRRSNSAVLVLVAPGIRQRCVVLSECGPRSAEITPRPLSHLQFSPVFAHRAWSRARQLAPLRFASSPSAPQTWRHASTPIVHAGTSSCLSPICARVAPTQRGDAAGRGELRRRADDDRRRGSPFAIALPPGVTRDGPTSLAGMRELDRRLGTDSAGDRSRWVTCWPGPER